MKTIWPSSNRGQLAGITQCLSMKWTKILATLWAKSRQKMAHLGPWARPHKAQAMDRLEWERLDECRNLRLMSLLSRKLKILKSSLLCLPMDKLARQPQLYRLWKKTSQGEVKDNPYKFLNLMHLFLLASQWLTSRHRNMAATVTLAEPWLQKINQIRSRSSFSKLIKKWASSKK